MYRADIHDDTDLQRRTIIMSNKVSNLVQTKKVGSPTKKAILMYMADKASDDGSGIWVSKSNMAADLELTDRAVRINIKSMIDDKILLEAGRRQCRSGYTVDYAINLDIVDLLEGTRSPELNSPLNLVHPKGGMTFTPTPEPRSPKPSIEPSIEPLFNYIDQNFSEVWRLYPKKIGKGAAKKAYEKAVRKIEPNALFQILGEYCRAIHGKELRYVPNLATWLNQERWEDDLPKPSSGGYIDQGMRNMIEQIAKEI